MADDLTRISELGRAIARGTDLTAEQAEKVARAAAPLWRALEEECLVDGFGGMECERVLPQAVGRILRLANPLRYLRVIAGPSGHWYALHEDELVALPQSAGQTSAADAPPHPVLGDDDGWYAPDDLQGEERERVLADLANERGETQC